MRTLVGRPARRRLSRSTGGAVSARPRGRRRSNVTDRRDRNMERVPFCLLACSSATAAVCGFGGRAGAAPVDRRGDPGRIAGRRRRLQPRAAGRADEYVRSATALAVARGALVEQEILPAFAATVVHDPAVLSTLATGSELTAAVAITAQLPSLRRATEAAVTALAVHPSVVAAGRRLATQLAAARAAMDNPAVLTTALTTVSALLDSMAAAQETQVAAATSQHLNGPVVQALHDAALAGLAARAAAEELALFTGTQFTEAGALGGRGQQWAQGWAAASAAAWIATRCRTPSIPTDPIAMNTVRIPSKASVRSRGSSRRVRRMCSPPGSPKAHRALPGREPVR